MKFRIPAMVLAAALLCMLYGSGARPISAGSTFRSLTQVRGTPALAPPQTPNSFTFVVAGDNRPPGATFPTSRIFKQIAGQLKGTGAAFVLWSGDTVFGKLKDPAKEEDIIKPEYETFRTIIGQAKLPVFNVPGNHEMNMKGNEPDPTGSMRKYYQKYLSSGEYGYFVYGNSAFIGLNTDDGPVDGGGEYNGNVSANQLAGLKGTLAALAANASIAHVFVFMHRPIFATGKGENALGRPSGPLVQAVLQDYKSYPNLSFVFAAHQHLFYASPPASPYASSFTRTDPAGVEPLFLISGGAGACLAGSATPTTGGFYNYLVVTVNGAQVTVTVQNLGSTQTNC
jgi:3',5'-cyclic AMP phosphodiesterase CpdA